MAAKEKGMAKAAANRRHALNRAREIALRLASDGREISADDIYNYFAFAGMLHLEMELWNAAGSIFRGKEWEFVRFKRSERESNHGRIIRVWRLRK